MCKVRMEGRGVGRPAWARVSGQSPALFWPEEGTARSQHSVGRPWQIEGQMRSNQDLMETTAGFHKKQEVGGPAMVGMLAG